MEALGTRKYVSTTMSALARDLTLLEGLTPSCRDTCGVLTDLNAYANFVIAGTRINLLGMFQLEIHYSRAVNDKLLKMLKIIGLTDFELSELHRAKLIKIHSIFSRFTKDIIFSKDLVLDECINKEMKTLPYNRVIKALLRSKISSEEAYNFIKEAKLNYLRFLGKNLKEVILKITKYVRLRREGDRSSLIDLKRNIEIERKGCGVISAENMLLHYPVLIERFALCKEMIFHIKKCQFSVEVTANRAPLLEPASSLEEVESPEK